MDISANLQCECLTKRPQTAIFKLKSTLGQLNCSFFRNLEERA